MKPQEPLPTIWQQTRHYEQSWRIPATFRDRICMCEEYGPLVFLYGGRIHGCGTCNKPKRWLLRICVYCKNYYIKDFRLFHTDCSRHSRCWDCITIDDTPCECYSGKPAPEHFNYDPIGLNPKKFTSEELVGVFDFDSPFD